MANYNKRFYVVFNGRQPGVYDNIDDALDQVDDYPGASFKSFATAQEASEAFRRSSARQDSTDLGALLKQASDETNPIERRTDYFAFPEIDLNGWAVDASCLGNPGVMEYRGVELMSGREIFRVGHGLGQKPQSQNPTGKEFRNRTCVPDDGTGSVLAQHP